MTFSSIFFFMTNSCCFILLYVFLINYHGIITSLHYVYLWKPNRFIPDFKFITESWTPIFHPITVPFVHICPLSFALPFIMSNWSYSPKLLLFYLIHMLVFHIWLKTCGASCHWYFKSYLLNTCSKIVLSV